MFVKDRLELITKIASQVRYVLRAGTPFWMVIIASLWSSRKLTSSKNATEQEAESASTVLTTTRLWLEVVSRWTVSQ